MKIDYRNNTNFSANLIAQSGNLKICKLTNKEDILFLENFSKKIDFKKLMPKLEVNEADTWHEMLKCAIAYAKNPLNTTYVTISDNKLCGIITSFPGTYFSDKTASIDGVCTIPINIGQKVKFAGKTLFYQIFKDFTEYNGNEIKLKAITDGPYDTIRKYFELGFRQVSDPYFNTVKMVADKFAIKDTIEKLKKIIPYKTLPNTEINLKDTITN